MHDIGGCLSGNEIPPWTEPHSSVSLYIWRFSLLCYTQTCLDKGVKSLIHDEAVRTGGGVKNAAVSLVGVRLVLVMLRSRLDLHSSLNSGDVLSGMCGEMRWRSGQWSGLWVYSLVHAHWEVMTRSYTRLLVNWLTMSPCGITLDYTEPGMKIFRFLPEFRFENSKSWVLNSKKSFRPAASNIGFRPIFRFPKSSPFSCLV